MKGIIPLVCIICYFSVCYPQSAQSINGIVFDARSGLRIGGLLVKNTKLERSTRTNDRGEFSLTVKIGDTLLLNVDGYTATQIIIVDFKDKVVQMQPSNSLAEVVVKASPLNKELLEVADSHGSKGIYFKGNPPLSLLSPFGGNPLTFLYEMTSKGAKNARRFDAYSSKLEEEYEINRRFNDKVIMSLVAIQATDIHRFKEVFKPTITQVREWNDVQLFDYIKKSYLGFSSK